MGVVHEITENATYEEKISQAGPKLVLVDFYALWCGPCKQIAPAVKRAAHTRDIVVLKVNIDEAPELSQSQEVRAMPTFKLYKQGKVVSQFCGANPEKLFSEIEKFM